ncbi:beta-galactosidase [Paucibacter sp. R3-3]|uniref:Beta-galactosidase n=1 Tax=Roseateles agri TaxID=3098619 RepID=A0ABU5DKU0_9BURK|nr:beta-galactosidase [Paucibacter sp. R3-3]MDY0746923.1 beta-galactosidase [Paucibacter sp. R3-3]
MKLGVCYYPEQWDEALWADDARRMKEMGISTVRIAEFAWGLMEPRPGEYDWAWLDRAIEVLTAQGLEIVMCTPTGAPPHWLSKQHPDIHAIDQDGHVKQFGSRRHYDFSSDAFFEASRKIVTAIAQRYGRHPAVVAWQTDNEYGCHGTITSFSPDALRRFRQWLAERYGHSIDKLNAAWGHAFWSMQYASFEDIGFPVHTAAPPNPSHQLAWKRFGSDEVIRYNRLHVDILREHSPGVPVLHNFMAFMGDFEHHEVGRDLDIASWDNYPLGFLDTMKFFEDEDRQRYRRCGHPDVSAFHHDLYRGVVASRRWWVMEQQPGPVNWAPWNALPQPGMVRAWTWEAFAHGAELVSYFRWRQAPVAQEQMHAGLHTPDDVLSPGGEEAMVVARELASMPAEATRPAEVALVVDYASNWATEILPNSPDFEIHALQLAWYGALRKLGLNVDIVPQSADLSGYALVVAPTIALPSAAFVESLKATRAQVLLGPRCGAKSDEIRIPEGLPPGPLRALLPGLRVVSVEGLRPGVALAADGALLGASITRWRELLDAPAGLAVEARYADGAPALVKHGHVRYLAGWLTGMGLEALISTVAQEAGLAVGKPLPEGLRLRRRGDIQFAVHYGTSPVQVPAPAGTQFLLGGPVLETAGVAAWKV